MGAFHHVLGAARLDALIAGAVEAALVILEQQVDDQADADEEQKLAQSVSFISLIWLDIADQAQGSNSTQTAQSAASQTDGCPASAGCRFS